MSLIKNILKQVCQIFALVYAEFFIFIDHASERNIHIHVPYILGHQLMNVNLMSAAEHQGSICIGFCARLYWILDLN